MYEIQRVAAALAGGLTLLSASSCALAQPKDQTYPSRPLRFIVPFPPGTDASSEQVPAERGAGTRSRDATVKPIVGASVERRSLRVSGPVRSFVFEAYHVM